MPHLKTISIGDRYVHLSHCGDCVYYSYSQRTGGLVLRGCYFQNNQIRSSRRPRQILTDFGIAQLIRDQCRSGSCFVSTIVCEILGLQDDCAELAVLRSLRSGYVLAHRRGRAWLADYAAHSEFLVPWLRGSCAAVPIAAHFFSEVITPTVAGITEGRLWSAVLTYRRGIRDLLVVAGISQSNGIANAIDDNSLEGSALGSARGHALPHRPANREQRIRCRSGCGSRFQGIERNEWHGEG